jgi:hypothetical protein
MLVHERASGLAEDEEYENEWWIKYWKLNR